MAEPYKLKHEKLPCNFIRLWCYNKPNKQPASKHGDQQKIMNIFATLNGNQTD